MRKRVISLVLVLVLAFALANIAAAAKTDVSVLIDRTPVKFTASDGIPFIDENSRTLVPLRIVMETYGCMVQWDQNTRTAYVVKDGVTVTVTIGQKYIRVNGMSQAIDTSAVIKDSRTYLPIRAVLEAFGAKVEWDAANRAVLVTSAAVPMSGKDGKDGISVSDAKIDDSGNLILTLSDGKTINAGVVRPEQVSDKTFEDYEVGTKFYLENPIGEFDAPLTYNGQKYTAHYSEIYYELIEKHSASDPKAWNGVNYDPYLVNVHIKGTTSPELNGKKLNVYLADASDSVSFYYTAIINADGSFNIDFVQGHNNSSSWHSPKTLLYDFASVLEK